MNILESCKCNDSELPIVWVRPDPSIATKSEAAEPLRPNEDLLPLGRLDGHLDGRLGH